MKVLIVDDNTEITNLIKQIAEMEGHTHIDIAYSGKEALAYVIGNTYDLITLDILMPDLSGLEVLSLLRNLNPHAVIGLISAHFPKTMSNSLARCSDVMIQKPVNIDIIIQLFKNASLIANGLSDIKSLYNAEVTITTIPSQKIMIK